MFAVSWEAVGAIGQWAGAVATTAAVIVSLRLARKSVTTALAVRTYYIGTGSIPPGDPAFSFIYPDSAIVVDLINTGTIPVRPRRLGIYNNTDGRLNDLPNHCPELLRVVEVGDGMRLYLRQSEVLVHRAIIHRDGGHADIVVEDTTGRYHYGRLQLPSGLPLPCVPAVTE